MRTFSTTPDDVLITGFFLLTIENLPLRIFKKTKFKILVEFE